MGVRFVLMMLSITLTRAFYNKMPPEGAQIIVHQPVAIVCSDTTRYEIRTSTRTYACNATSPPLPHATTQCLGAPELNSGAPSILSAENYFLASSSCPCSARETILGDTVAANGEAGDSSRGGGSKAATKAPTQNMSSRPGVPASLSPQPTFGEPKQSQVRTVSSKSQSKQTQLLSATSSTQSGMDSSSSTAAVILDTVGTGNRTLPQFNTSVMATSSAAGSTTAAALMSIPALLAGVDASFNATFASMPSTQPSVTSARRTSAEGQTTSLTSLSSKPSGTASGLDPSKSLIASPTTTASTGASPSWMSTSVSNSALASTPSTTSTKNTTSTVATSSSSTTSTTSLSTTQSTTSSISSFTTSSNTAVFAPSPSSSIRSSALSSNSSAASTPTVFTPGISANTSFVTPSTTSSPIFTSSLPADRSASSSTASSSSTTSSSSISSTSPITSLRSITASTTLHTAPIANSTTTSSATTSSAIPTIRLDANKYLCNRYGHLLGVSKKTIFTGDEAGGSAPANPPPRDNPVKRDNTHHLHGRAYDVYAPSYALVDLIKGEVIHQVSVPDNSLTNLNAACYNEADNFLYAVNCGDVLQVDVDLKTTSVAKLPSAECAATPIRSAPGLADCRDGFMHIRSKTMKWRVNLKTKSVEGPFPFERDWSLADISIYNGSVYGAQWFYFPTGAYSVANDGLKYAPCSRELWLMEEVGGLTYANQPAGGWRKLRKILSTTGNCLEDIVEYPTEPIIATFVTQDGILYLGDSTGALRRLDLTDSNSIASPVARWSAYFGDGARCDNATEKQRGGQEFPKGTLTQVGDIYSLTFDYTVDDASGLSRTVGLRQYSQFGDAPDSAIHASAPGYAGRATICSPDMEPGVYTASLEYGDHLKLPISPVVYVRYPPPNLSGTIRAIETEKFPAFEYTTNLPVCGLYVVLSLQGSKYTNILPAQGGKVQFPDLPNYIYGGIWTASLVAGKKTKQVIASATYQLGSNANLSIDEKGKQVTFQVSYSPATPARLGLFYPGTKLRVALVDVPPPIGGKPVSVTVRPGPEVPFGKYEARLLAAGDYTVNAYREIDLSRIPTYAGPLEVNYPTGSLAGTAKLTLVPGQSSDVPAPAVEYTFDDLLPGAKIGFSATRVPQYVFPVPITTATGQASNPVVKNFISGADSICKIEALTNGQVISNTIFAKRVGGLWTEVPDPSK